MNSLQRIPNNWPNRELSQSIEVGQLHWHVQISGDSGPTILLLHGTGASAHSWSEIISKLANHARIVVPDLPGHAYTLNALANYKNALASLCFISTNVDLFHYKTRTFNDA